MIGNTDYYSILGVMPWSEQKEIDVAYKEKVKTYHPDVYSGDKQYAEEEIKKINEAYTVLKDPFKRDEYDQLLKSNIIELKIIKISDEQKNLNKKKIIQERKKQLDNLIMGLCVFSILLVFILNLLIK